MPSRKGIPNKKTQDFRAKFDDLAGRYCDPLERLFVFAENADGKYGFDVALNACRELVQYRYCKLKSVELSLGEELEGALEIKWKSSSPMSPDGIKRKRTKKKQSTGSESKSGTAAPAKPSEPSTD